MMGHTAGLDVSEKRISCRYKCTLAKLTTSKIHCPTDIILSEEKQSKLVGRIKRKQRFGYGPTIKYLCNILFQLCNSNIKHQFRGGKAVRRWLEGFILCHQIYHAALAVKKGNV
jgi:hypothetical protein